MKSKFENVFVENIFLFTLILGSGTLFNIAFSTYVSAISIASAILLLILNSVKTVSRKAVVCYACVVVFLLGQSLFIDMETWLDTTKFSFKFAFTILGVQVLLKNKVDIFGRIAYIHMWLTFISFLVYLSMVFGFSLPTQSIPNQSYLGVLYFNVQNVAIGLAGSGITLPRNFGIYWEPGLYQVFLNMLLLYYLLIKRNIILVFFFCINIILTFSVTGYITSLLIFLFYSLSDNKGIKKKLIIVIVIIVILFALPWLLDFFQFKMTTGSYRARTQDIFSGIEMFLENPIFGIGISQLDYKNMYYDLFGVIHGNTNGLINIGLQFGLIGILFYLSNFYWTFLFWCKYYNKIFAMAFLVWLVCSLINEPIERIGLVMLFMSIGMIIRSKTDINQYLGPG